MGGRSGNSAAQPSSGDVQWFDNTHRSLRRCYHPVAEVAALDGSGPFEVELLGQSFALFRSKGTWTALPNQCPHRLAPLTTGWLEDRVDRADTVIRCGYHGWCFDAAGQCVDIPSAGDGPVPPTSHLTPLASVQEAYGLLWLSIDEPVAPLPQVVEWDDPGFGLARLPVQEWHAGAAQITDNFLDVAHFPFMHLGTIGDPDDKLVGDYTVTRDNWVFTAVHRHKAALVDGSGTIVDRTMEFECTAPHHLRLRLDYGEHGATVLLFFHQPVAADRTRLYIMDLSTSRADGAGDPQQAIDFQMAVGAEDRVILEQFPHKGVPMTPGLETHVKADRITVEYRRVLTDLAGLA